MDGSEGAGELSPGCCGWRAVIAGGRGVAGDAGAEDIEPGLALREGDSASAMVLGDQRSLPCFLSAEGPAQRAKLAHDYAKDRLIQTGLTCQSYPEQFGKATHEGCSNMRDTPFWAL